MSATSPRMRAARLAAYAAALVGAFAWTPALAELPPPSTSPPVFEDRPFGPKPPPTPPQPSVVRSAAGKPIPRSWIFGGVAFGAVGAGVVLFFALRAWRMARLFGRQYRFPVRAKVAVRLGGERSGGLIATTQFAAGAQTVGAGSKPKDA